MSLSDSERIARLNRAIGCYVGLFIGDALGTPVEFKERDEYEPVTNMRGGGAFRLQPGEWTDDGSMAFALAESLIEYDALEPSDVLDRWLRWHDDGDYSVTGKCFDIGKTTWLALTHYRENNNALTCGQDGTFAAGNGSIMRNAPIVLKFLEEPEYAQEMAALQSRLTHAHTECIAGCKNLTDICIKAINGAPKEELFDCNKLRALDRSVISSSGYVLHTLMAAKWAVAKTDNFHDALLLAVNLGDDADTVGAVTGQIAGALYGYGSIPHDWLNVLAWKDQITTQAQKLLG